MFDLNYKFIKIGASRLALAKSIYYIYIIAEKWAYIKYETVLFYFNDRLNGFSTPNLPFELKKKKVKDCIIVVVSEKGYRLLSYVSPQRKYAPYGKTF